MRAQCVSVRTRKLLSVAENPNNLSECCNLCESRNLLLTFLASSGSVTVSNKHSSVLWMCVCVLCSMPWELPNCDRLREVRVSVRACVHNCDHQFHFARTCYKYEAFRCCLQTVCLVILWMSVTGGKNAFLDLFAYLSTHNCIDGKVETGLIEL